MLSISGGDWRLVECEVYHRLATRIEEHVHVFAARIEEHTHVLARSFGYIFKECGASFSQNIWMRHNCVSVLAL